MSKIDIVPYDSHWLDLFDALAHKIKEALGDQCIAIYHVGSTAVPGLASKPRIDIIAEVQRLNFDHSGLIDLNYAYRGGFNLPLRKSFTYRLPELSANLHVFEKGDPEVELNLMFRNYLRAHPQARDAYAALKYQLSQKASSHIKEGTLKNYTLGKHDFIKSILKKSGFNRLRLVFAAHITEWEAAKKYRAHYFKFQEIDENPASRIFDDTNHKHFILYQGTEIAGYAHVQICPDQHEPTLHMLEIDDKIAGNNTDKLFRAFIQKWLKFEGYDSKF